MSNEKAKDITSKLYAQEQGERFADIQLKYLSAPSEEKRHALSYGYYSGYNAAVKNMQQLAAEIPTHSVGEPECSFAYEAPKKECEQLAHLLTLEIQKILGCGRALSIETAALCSVLDRELGRLK